jgi:hypothetical protein
MPLSDEQRREIAQLMFVALHYLDRASDAEQYAIKMGTTADKFPATGDLDETTGRLTIIGADLASAATRLASVDDVLDAAGYGRDLYSPCRKYFSRVAPGATDPRGSECSVWFHIMFRDAVGHAEPSESTELKVKERYLARQICLQETTFAAAYAQLRKTAGELGALCLRHRITTAR